MKAAAIIVPLVLIAAATAQPPQVVVLKELSSVYEPVTFDHKSHAEMAEMWDGCVTCHHRSPTEEATTQPQTAKNGARTQADTMRIPACKSCHEIGAEKADIRMPNLKGAYHRQCLNCHRDWAHENGCSACHRQRNAKHPETKALPPPTVDDIVGRMHPPIPEPDVHVYQARFTPAVGAKAIFRHKEHTATYGLKCSNCHHRSTCANCHADNVTTIAQKPVRPGRTWKDSHGPCMSCHKQDGCRHCHYDEGSAPPTMFEHRTTGQLLDADHATLRCGQCHTQLKSKVGLTCGGTECHKRGGVAFPNDRPGATMTTQPAVVQLAVAPSASTQPTTRPVIRRIRRGGS